MQRMIASIALIGLASCGQADQPSTNVTAQANGVTAAHYDEMDEDIRTILCAKGSVEDRAKLLDEIINSPKFDDDRDSAGTGSTDDALLSIEAEGCDPAPNSAIERQSPAEAVAPEA